jgi:hypothetical protein
MNIDDLLKEVQERIEYYGRTANDIVESAKSIHTHRDDPYEAQKIFVEGMKVQELSAEYMKLAAQLHCVSLAHKAAAKAGFES